jgi:hypothetical protein
MGCNSLAVYAARQRSLAPAQGAAVGDAPADGAWGQWSRPLARAGRRAALPAALWACSTLPALAVPDAIAAAAAPGLSLAGLPDWLRSIPPWAFVLGFVVLPALGFPISLFYLTVGAVFPDPGLALAVALACMTANMAVSYVGARVLSRPVQGLLHRRGYPLPQLTEGAEWRAIVLLRASPLPWLMQSWLLALGGARFLPYMLVGAPVQSLVGAGMVLVGESLFQGNAVWLLVGVTAFLLGQAALTALRWRLRGRGSAY